jgi:hypothetical protein
MHYRAQRAGPALGRAAIREAVWRPLELIGVSVLRIGMAAALLRLRFRDRKDQGEKE